MIFSSKQIIKALVSFSGCAGWCASLLFMKTGCSGDRFSRDEANFIVYHSIQCLVLVLVAFLVVTKTVHRSDKNVSCTVNCIYSLILPINSNMCFGCSKEPSQWDGSFEHPQHMFWLRNKKTTFQYALLSGCLEESWSLYFKFLPDGRFQRVERGHVSRPSLPGKPQVAISFVRNTGKDPLEKKWTPWDSYGPL